MDYRSDLSWFLVLLLSLALFFPGLGSYPLLDPDEGRNAQVALEAARGGHWIPPTLEGKVRYQKPPLYYWMVAASFLALGPGEAPARLPSALAALVGVFLVFLLGDALWGRERGLLAALITATSLIYVVYAHLVIFDMVLTTFILASLFFSWKGLEEKGKRDWVLASLFMALAFLTKGPVGVIIPLMALVPLTLYKLLVDKERLSIPFLLGLGIFLMVALPPFLLLEMKSPGYCYHFFWKENVVRYLKPVFHREAPFYFYLAVILLGLVPWTLYLPRILTRIKGLGSLYPHRTIFLASWIVLPTLFFSLAKAKMPHYILPTFPAWALLLAGTWEEEHPAPIRLISFLIILYLVLFLVIMPIYSRRKSAAFAVPLIVKNDGTPLYTYKTPRAYSLTFYSGRSITNFQTLEELEKALEAVKVAYTFTKKEKLPRLEHLPCCSTKVIGTSPRYALVLVTKGHSPPKGP